MKLLEEHGMLVEDKGGVLCDLTKEKLGKVVVRKGGECRIVCQSG